jgi:hypothetical protein
MIDPDKAIQKLRKPPAVQNWVKSLRKRRDDTAFALYNFAINGPRHSLKKILDIIGYVVFDELSNEDAYKCLSRITDPKVRAYGQEIFRVILPYIKSKNWKGIQIFKNMEEYYRVAKNVSVPVRPTFVVNDRGMITLYFVICWAEIGLSHYQKRIMSTVITDAILSLEEFQGSEAVIVCAPRFQFSKSERKIVEWKISDYEILSDEEKDELFERYGYALEDAEKMIFDNFS